MAFQRLRGDRRIDAREIGTKALRQPEIGGVDVRNAKPVLDPQPSGLQPERSRALPRHDHRRVDDETRPVPLTADLVEIRQRRVTVREQAQSQCSQGVLFWRTSKPDAATKAVNRPRFPLLAPAAARIQRLR